MSLFEQDTQLEELADGHYRAQVSGNWSIMHAPNGGYLMALLGKAMGLYASQPAPTQITVNYSGKTEEAKPLDIYVRRFGQSRQFDRLEATAKQGDKTVLKAMGTFMAGYEGHSYSEERLSQLSPIEACSARAGIPGLPVFDNVEMRVDPAVAGWMTGQTVDSPEIYGWMRVPSIEAWSPTSIMLACDTCPPSIFVSKGALGWVPTIEMSVHIKAIPTTEWLKVRFHSKYLGSTLLQEDGELWDENDNLVAVSRQLAQFIKAK
ncbi:MAG: thioesterase family protein [Cellvibrionaceae bacterium]|nr:thioesterase family protein [Cellvibrionaceae bacterium]MCV6626183.1 thioesterase family protein [Cellvibrionaceae bacterium]